MNDSFQSDPRLLKMPPEKLKLLTDFAEKLEKAPQNQKINTFLALNRRAVEKKLIFTKEETELLISILTEGMSPEEKKKVQMIRTLAGQMKKR